MRLGRLAILMASGVIALALPASALAAAPPGVIDQSHECQQAASCNFPGGAQYPHWNNTISTMDALGQTFTAGVTGNLTGVEVYVDRLDAAAPSSLTVQIESTASGKPSGTILASVDIPTLGMPAPAPGWVAATLASPLAVTAGTMYAITLPAVTSGGPWLAWQVDCSDAGTCPTYTYSDYTGGEGYASVGGSWLSLFGVLNDGGTGTADLAFRTYVQAAAPSPSPSPIASPSPSPSPSPSAKTTLPPTDQGTNGSSNTGSIPTLVVLLTVIGAAAIVVRPRAHSHRP